MWTSKYREKCGDTSEKNVIDGGLRNGSVMSSNKDNGGYLSEQNKDRRMLFAGRCEEDGVTDVRRGCMSRIGEVQRARWRAD